MARGVVADASATVTTQQVTLLAANANRTFLFIANNHASNTLSVNLAGGTAATNGAGCITLAAGGSILLDYGVPTNAITAIASASGTIATVQSITGGAQAV